ncbi:hypothetical protein NEOLEDRAFT_167647, partial [Neolentinus lepideus HHB14362 ss-1]
LETLRHILTTCNSPGQREIWDLARSLWLKQNADWYEPSLGLLLACCNGQFKTVKGHIKYGDAHFYHISMTESLHLIWKLCCECIIQNEGVPLDPRAVWNCWLATMN